ncbi:hypothetical protein FACS1894180_6190 [Bacteroidia bacterium]|nr:hypothetical protein FACS1894180_6190 [Bacteroidia bacterium]
MIIVVLTFLAIGNAHASDSIAIQHTYYTEYNMSIHSFYGDIAGQPTGQTGEQKFRYYHWLEEYNPPLWGELSLATGYGRYYPEGQMPQDWNNPATLQNVGWYYEGISGEKMSNMTVDWTKILDIANNTQICPGGTLAITDSVTGTVLAAYAGIDANGQSILNIDSAAYLQFLENNKTVTHSEEYLGNRYEYAYIGGVLTRIEIEQWSYIDSTTYNLSVKKSVGVEIPTGIAEAASGKLQIYVVGNLLSFENLTGLNSAVQVFDVRGVAVETDNYPSLHRTIDISHLPTGVYIVKAGGKTGKFIKK